MPPLPLEHRGIGNKNKLELELELKTRTKTVTNRYLNGKKIFMECLPHFIK
jgi:hypothetical protein